MSKTSKPHVKAAEIEKQAVRALSEKEIDEALTASTFGGEKKLEPLDEDDIIIKGFEEENERLRQNAEEAERCYKGVRIELMDRNKEITKLKKTIEELRKINDEWAGGSWADYNVLCGENFQLREDLGILKTECINLKEENKKHLRTIDELKKTNSKVKYAHEEEVRALEDELAEAKILGKKAGEYSSMLDEDSDAFEKILDLTDSLKCQVQAMRGVLGLISSEVEGHI